jgi:hypothetical protein
MTCPVAASLSSSFRVCNRGRRHGVLNDRLDLPHAVQRPANKLLDSLERHHCTDTELAVAFSAEHVAHLPIRRACLEGAGVVAVRCP